MKVLNKISATNTYTLDLPEMCKRRIHPMFHIGLLCQYEENNDALFLRRNAQAFYDVRQTKVNKVITHQWARNRLKFLMKWNLGDSTWEPSSSCKELEPLDRYLKLQGVSNIHQLPHRAELTSKCPKNHH